MNPNLGTRPDDAGRPASILNVFAGIWLIISPWAVGFFGHPAALWNTLLVGIAVLILAAIRLATPGAPGFSWINFLLGIWLIISPFVLGFSPERGAMGNDVIMGIVVGLLGLWAALATPRSAAPLPR